MKYTLDIKPETYSMMYELAAQRNHRIVVCPLETGNLAGGLMNLHHEAQTGQLSFTFLPQRLLDEGPTAAIRESFRQERVVSAVILPEQLGVCVVENKEGKREELPLSLILSCHEKETVIGRKNMLLSTQIYEKRIFRNKLLVLERQEYVIADLPPVECIRKHLESALSDPESVMENDSVPQDRPEEDEELLRIREFCRENNGRDFFYQDERVTLNYDERTDSVAIVASGMEDIVEFRNLEECQSDIGYIMELENSRRTQSVQDFEIMEQNAFLSDLVHRNYDSSLDEIDYLDLRFVSNDFIEGDGDKWEPLEPIFCHIRENSGGYQGLAKLVEVEIQSASIEEEIVIHLIDADNKPHTLWVSDDQILFTREDVERLHHLALNARSEKELDTLSPDDNEVQMQPQHNLPHPEVPPIPMVESSEIEEEQKTVDIVENVISKSMLKQFDDLKKKHPEALLLFRCGDSYESYREDAKRLNEVMAYALTHRPVEGKRERIEYSTFPYNHLDFVLPKLIRAGNRVAICDQIEAPKPMISRTKTKVEVPEQETQSEMDTSLERRTYNLYTNEHGDSDRSWDDYLDFTPGEGLKFSTNDWTYGSPSGREHILSSSDMNDDEVQEAKEVMKEYILKDGRVMTPNKWIGSSQARDYRMRCIVKGSKKYNGEARLMNIGSKRDRFGREAYYAYILTPEGKNYQISPKCIIPQKKHINIVLDKMKGVELAGLVDELKHGHWNFPGYNQHLFRWPEQLARYAFAVSEQIKADEHILTTVDDIAVKSDDEDTMTISLTRSQGDRSDSLEYEANLKVMGLHWEDEFEQELAKDIQKDTVEYYRIHDRLPDAHEMRILTESHHYDMVRSHYEDNDHIVVTWPDSQMLTETKDFEEKCTLIESEDGISKFGSNAYQVDKQWYELFQKGEVALKEPEINVALRRWQDDIAIFHAHYEGSGMEMKVSRDGHVFLRDPENTDTLIHEYYFRSPKDLLTRESVAAVFKREGVSPEKMLEMILNPEKAAECYECLCNYGIKECRMDCGIFVEGDEVHDDFSDARHLWSRDIVEAGCTHYDYDSDMTCNETFIAPDGHVFVYYPDAKGEPWEDEIYSHYKFPDFREMTNEGIVEALKGYHNEHSIFRAYEIEDIECFRKQGGDWTCKLLEDVMMCTELNKLEQTHYLANVRQAAEFSEYRLEKAIPEDVLENDYNLLTTIESNLMQDYKRQNTVELTGFIASTPEFKTLPNSGKDLMSFNLALRTGDSRQMGQDGKPETKSLLIRVEKFLKEGEREKFAPLCEKAKMVTVSGYVAGQEKYENKQGTKVNTLRLVAHDVKSYVKAAEGEQSNFKNSLVITGRLTKDIAWVGKEETKLNANLAYFSAKENDSDPKFFLGMSKFLKPEQKEAILPLLNPNNAVKVEGWLEAVEFTNKEGTKVNTFNFVPKTIEAAELKEQTQEGEQEKPAISVNREELNEKFADAMQTLRQEGINPDKLSDAQLHRIFEEKKGTDLTTDTGARKTIQLQKSNDGYDIKATLVKPKSAQKDDAAEM